METSINNLDIKNFCEQWWTIEQLVNSFWASLSDSCKKSAEKWNLNSLENVIKTFDLFQKSKNKKLSECIKECNVSNFSEDLNLCHNLMLLQIFCKEKELHSGKDMIDNDKIDFIDFSWINIFWTNNLSNRWLISEIRDSIQHHKYICLPEWIYIDNPIWPKHKINFKAIVKRNFIESVVNNLYFNIQRHYATDVDYSDVDFEKWFEVNKDKIKLSKRLSKNKKADPIGEDYYKRFTSDYFISNDFEKKEYTLTEKEKKMFSKIFNSHVFWPWEVFYLFNSLLQTRNDLVNELILLLHNYDWTYKSFEWTKKVRQISWLISLDLPSVPAWFDKYYDYEHKFLPSYFELMNIFDNLVNDIFEENSELLKKSYKERKKIIFQIIDERLKKYLTKYLESNEYYKKQKLKLEFDKLYSIIDYSESEWNKQKESDFFKLMDSTRKNVDEMDISEYKDEIVWRKNLPQKTKNSYLDMMKNDILNIFDYEFERNNIRYISNKFILENTVNTLKALYVYNYYINDPSFVPLWNVQSIPEREHIRNAFAHCNYLILPWSNDILLKDPSKRHDTWDWEKLYNLNYLYERCLRKTGKRFVS